MRGIRKTLAFGTMSLVLCSGMVFAQDDHQDQDHHDQSQHDEHHGDQNHGDQNHGDQNHHDQYVRHNDWHRGGHINHDDWNRGREVDWHSHHLRQPPRGYQWREVDGNYVLAAVATGVIASIIAASASH